MASQQDSRSLVAGIQLGLKREAVRGDARGGGFRDFKKLLQHFLKGVFDDGGKVVLAFPDSTYAQVSRHYIDNQYNQLALPKLF